MLRTHYFRNSGKVCSAYTSRILNENTLGVSRNGRMRQRNAPEDSVFARCVFVLCQVRWYRGLLDAPFHRMGQRSQRRVQDERSTQADQYLNVPMDISVASYLVS